MFETYETIKRAENIIEESEIPVEATMISENVEITKEFLLRNADAEAGGTVDGRNVIVVPKPNSLSNAMFKVFEDDFLNESKAYILDLNSGNLVSNPSFKVKK